MPAPRTATIVVTLTTLATACGLTMLAGLRQTASASPTPTPTPTSTSTSTTSTSTTTIVPAPSPVPASVSPTAVTVGVGGVARISGACPVVDERLRGPVQIWEVGETSTTVIDTGITAATWTYDWTAPSTIQPLRLRAWCGDPAGFEGVYPANLEIAVTFVAQIAPTTAARDVPVGILPATR